MPEEFEADEMVEETPSKPKAKKGKSKLLIVGVPVVLIQLAAAYLLINWLFVDKMPEKEQKEVSVEKKKEKTKFGLPYSIENLTINIPTEERRNTYMVANIGFECEDDKTVAELTLRNNQIKDIIISTLMSKKKNQLMDSKFVDDTLKSELRDKINDILMDGSVLNIFFGSRIIQ